MAGLSDAGPAWPTYQLQWQPAGSNTQSQASAFNNTFIPIIPPERFTLGTRAHLPCNTCRNAAAEHMSQAVRPEQVGRQQKELCQRRWAVVMLMQAIDAADAVAPARHACTAAVSKRLLRMHAAVQCVAALCSYSPLPKTQTTSIFVTKEEDAIPQAQEPEHPQGVCCRGEA